MSGRMMELLEDNTQNNNLIIGNRVSKNQNTLCDHELVGFT
jgi:hypothetical protein